MKYSLALGPRRTLSRQSAWGCFTTNLAMPGFGSLAAGYRRGYFQAALGLGGLALTSVFAAKFFLWYLTHSAELQADPSDPMAGLHALWMAARWPLSGVAVFAVGWGWALLTSLGILYRAKASETGGVPPVL